MCFLFELCNIMLLLSLLSVFTRNVAGVRAVQDGRRKEGRMSGMAWGHDNKLGFTSLLIYATDIYIDLGA